MEDYLKFKRLIESLGNEYFFYSHNLNGEYLYMSPSVEIMLGYSVDEAIEGLVKHMTESKLNKKTIETLKKSASGERQKTFELELYTKSRNKKVLEITESPVFNEKGELVAVDGVAHDITGRIKNEQIIQKQNKELQKQEKELRVYVKELEINNKHIDKLKKEVENRSNLLLHIINEIPEKLFVKDSKGRFILANNPVAANFGLTPEELIGKSDFDFYPKDEAQMKFDREKEIVKNGNVVSYEEGDFNKEDGLIVNTKIKPFNLGYEEQDGVLGIQFNITDLRRNEIKLNELNQELKEHEKELQNTIQHLKNTQAQLVQSEKMGALGNLIAGIAHEINTPIGAINASADNISRSLDEAISNLYSLFTKLSKQELVIFLRVMKMIDKSKPSLISKEKRQYKKQIKETLTNAGIDNSFAIADHLIYLNLYDTVDKVLPLLTDIENPDFVLKSVRDIYSVRKNSENIKLAVDKASKIVFALKRFAHKDQGGEKERANLADNIEIVLTLHHNRLKQGIDVVQEYDDIPLINCYADELGQVWTNLISNAIQAMDNDGQMTIGIKNLGERVQVTISDTGCGIPDENREKIFEPFFTTKKAGEGTGIGLDLVAKIIDKHQGKLDLESKIGVGTTFTITLPVN